MVSAPLGFASLLESRRAIADIRTPPKKQLIQMSTHAHMGVLSAKTPELSEPGAALKVVSRTQIVPESVPKMICAYRMRQGQQEQSYAVGALQDDRCICRLC
jgi:hypothetical protein